MHIVLRLCSKVGASGILIVRFVKRSFHEETSCQQRKVAQPFVTEGGVKLNNRLIRPIFAMGAFAALAASSQAQISFSNLPSDITQVGYGDVQVQNNNLGDANLQGAPGGGLQYTESFKLNEASNTVVKATVDEVLSGVSDGSLSLTAWINGTQFYNSSVTNLDGTGNTETALATTGFAILPSALARTW
jgi:hypothetical protein